MSERHWSREDFIGRLYGIGPEDGHLDGCERCSEQWARYAARREELRLTPEVPAGLLQRQRRAVRERLSGRPARRLQFRPVPVLAALLLFMVVISVFDRRSEQPSAPAITETEIFEEAFEMAASPEPSALEPLRGLFEVQQ